MTGGECLLRTLAECGVSVCFMNPGTSEMQFVAALDRVAEMRGVLCLQEGVCSGAADGYARMMRRPAATLLHLGPGLANALSNFHNARKARSPIVNLVGEHSTKHQAYDAPLTADIAALARPMSNWVKTPKSAGDIGPVAAEAVAASMAAPAGVATLIIPADFSWSPTDHLGAATVPAAKRVPSTGAINEAARILRHGEGAALLLSGSALLEGGLRAAARIRSATGVKVFANRFTGRVRRGRGVLPAISIPYFPEPAEEALAGLKYLVLVETQPPVSFFGYPNRRSIVAPPDCKFHHLTSEVEDNLLALEALADALDAPQDVAPPVVKFEAPAGDALTLESMGAAIATLLPEEAIVSDEMVSSADPVNKCLLGAAPHDALPGTGGSIGLGLPVGVGAAVACPHRRVVCLEADGSGMYTPQSLWTMAREHLNVTTVVFANRRYRILDIEMRRSESAPPGPCADAMMDLHSPELDWVSLAKGMGVEAARAETLPAFTDLFRQSVRRNGPFLIEACL